ncbi:hypothetical protein D9M71_820520 [compost metagenome]
MRSAGVTGVIESVDFQCRGNGLDVGTRGCGLGLVGAAHDVRQHQCAENAKDNDHDHDLDQGETPLCLEGQSVMGRHVS